MQNNSKHSTHSQNQIVKHIKLVARELFGEHQSPARLIKTIEKATPQANFSRNVQGKWWSDPQQNKQYSRKEREPISDVIKRQVYGRFKDDSAYGQNIEKTSSKNKDRIQESWDKFLKRQRYRQDQKKQIWRVKQLKEYIQKSKQTHKKKSSKLLSKTLKNSPNNRYDSMNLKKEKLMRSLLEHTKDIQLRLIGMLHDTQKKQQQLKEREFSSFQTKNSPDRAQKQRQSSNSQDFWKQMGQKLSFKSAAQARFYHAINKAIGLNKIIFEKDPEKQQHALRMAEYAKQCKLASTEQYSIIVLLSILHQSKLANDYLFCRFLDAGGLSGLLPNERADIIDNISKMTLIQSASKLKREKEYACRDGSLVVQVQPMQWVMLFDRCERILEMRKQKVQSSEIQGFEAVSYLYYFNILINKPRMAGAMGKTLHQIFREIGGRFGGEQGALRKAQEYYKLLQ